MASLPVGKVPKDVLKRLVFTCLGAPSSRLLKGPQVGEDSAIIDMGETVIIAKANPITGATTRIGWLAVHINANDVAVRGAKPFWYMSQVLLPEGSTEDDLDTIMKDQHEACTSLGVCVVGGHTEVAPGLTRPIIAGFMLGEAPKDRYITTGGAQPGDHIILTKGAGIEGTGILAADMTNRLEKEVDKTTLHNARLLLDQISVVPEAVIASATPGVHSIHTPTEGGVLNGLHEVAEASGQGFRVYRDKLLILEETRLICMVLGVDPLKLLSSGSLLVTVHPDASPGLVTRLNAEGVQARVIGEVTAGGRVVVESDGSESVAEDVLQDELFRILEGEH